MTRKSSPVASRKTQQKELPAARLDRLIEEATVDAYDESEQASGFFTMFEEYLAVPFKTEVLDMEVTVPSSDTTVASNGVKGSQRAKSLPHSEQLKGNPLLLGDSHTE